MKIVHTTIKVADLDKSLEFYEKILGVKPNSRFKAGPSEIAFLGSGEAALELIQGPEGPGSYEGVSVGIACEDVEARKAELDGAGFRTTEIVSPQPGLHFFFVKDPDGLNIQFIDMPVS